MIWLGTTVKLGERTLFEHIQAIWKTPESQQLVRGTKDKVGDLMDRATGHVVKGVARNASNQITSRGEASEPERSAETPPMEDVQAKDRKALRGLIGQAHVEKSN